MNGFLKYIGLSSLSALHRTETQRNEERDRTLILSRELNTTSDRLITTQTRIKELENRLRTESDERSKLTEKIAVLEKLVKDGDNRFAVSEKARNNTRETIQQSNNLLYEAGKTWASFIKAWKYRQDNPKMAPATRKANTEDLNRLIETFTSQMPQKVGVTVPPDPIPVPPESKDASAPDPVK